MSIITRALWAIALVLTVLALVGNAMLANYNAHLLVASGNASARSRDVLYAIDDVLSDLTDAETGQRGYILTHRPEYLAPYRTATQTIAQKISVLRAFLAEEPEQLLRLKRLEPLVADKLNELQRTVDLFDAGDSAAAMALVTTDAGMLTMRAVRLQTDEMRAAERSLQTIRDADATALYAATRYSELAGMAIGLALVALAILLLRRHLRERDRAAREVFEQREWLRITLRSIGDGVIVTDPQARVVLLNPVAEALTAWSTQDAMGRPLLEVFDIIDETTRQPAANPVARAVAEGKIVGLANHTVLRARDGREYVIEDSAAPTVDASGTIQGAVLVFHDATERRTAELALAAATEGIAQRARAALASERTLNTILENAPIGISMTGPGPDFAMVAMSRQMHEWLGPGENKPSRTLYRKVLPDGTVPPTSMLPLTRAMNEGVVVRDEAWIVERPGGTPLTVIVNVAPVRDDDGLIVGAVHSWVDMSEQQRLDRALHVTQSRLRVLVESNVIGLMLSFDRHGTVTQANGALLNMLDFDNDDLANGRINLAAQTPGEYAKFDEAAFNQLVSAGVCAPYEKEFMRKDGVRISVVVAYARVFETADEYVGFALDVTARKELEGRLRQQAEQLLLADSRKDEFLAMLAHELRNPLAPLRNALHLLEVDRKRQWSTVETLLPTMRRQIDQLVRMVDDLLDTARISQNKIVLERGIVDLKPILLAAIETVQPLIGAYGHKLDVEVDTQPLFVDGDSARLIQAFANILHNAAKYTANNGNIKVFLSRQGDTAIFRVCDTGEGIASELLPRIFDTFTQADQSLARSAGGLGVGLALVRRLCELHGGEVRASSAGLGKGSEFEVRLPTVTPPSDADIAREQISPVAAGGAPLRVLVAEDNRDIANSTTALLELWGHESQMVHSGKDVVPAALIFRPDIVLLDIGLPEVDGFEVARRIRNEPTLVSVRVIAMTGYGQDRDRDRTRETGFDAHLVKPVQAQVLKAMIEQR